MKIYFNKFKKWEFNYLEIFDIKEKNSLHYYFKFLNSKQFKKLDGDVIEAGVFRGKSLITTGLILSNLNSKKKIYGYDSFSGFPSFSIYDRHENFEILRNKKIISQKHFNEVLKIKKYHKRLKKKDISINNISSSSNFANTNINYVKKKIHFFKLNNIKLVKGDFRYTMKKFKNLPKKISAGLIDCDLYDGYKISLETFWPKLIKNGKLFLDEYYSLKFPGPRIYMNKFLQKNQDAKLIKEGITGDFERWSLKKI